MVCGLSKFDLLFHSPRGVWNDSIPCLLQQYDAITLATRSSGSKNGLVSGYPHLGSL